MITSVNNGKQAAEKQPPPRGPLCPDCGCERSWVYYTRKLESKTRRVRICYDCARKFVTTERVVG